jgi:hypothetical protein
MDGGMGGCIPISMGIMKSILLILLGSVFYLLFRFRFFFVINVALKVIGHDRRFT